MSDLELKKALLKGCRAEIEQRISNLQAEFMLYKDAAANETKSTSGDKHDTSRSMMQLEQEKMGQQLKDLLKQKQILDSMDLHVKPQKIAPGTIIETESIHFFVSVFAKPITITNSVYHPVSMQAPLIQLMRNAVVGDVINYHGKTYRISRLVL